MSKYKPTLEERECIRRRAKAEMLKRCAIRAANSSNSPLRLQGTKDGHVEFVGSDGMVIPMPRDLLVRLTYGMHRSVIMGIAPKPIQSQYWENIKGLGLLLECARPQPEKETLLQRLTKLLGL